ATVSASPQQVNESVENQLTKSFAGAEAIAEQYPQYAGQITAAARSSFLQGDQWAYTAGVVAVVLGATLVFFLFPARDEERALLERYQAEDTQRESEAAPQPSPAVPEAAPGPAASCPRRPGASSSSSTAITRRSSSRSEPGSGHMSSGIGR